MRHTYFSLLLLLFCFINATAQEYYLNGNAQFIGGDCYRLTTEATYQNGTVWYGNQIDLNEPFDIQFTMNFGTLDGGGADGICFVLQTVGTSAIGASGGGLGYLNFGTSLGIEFDTWQNGEYNDQGYDHIAIIKNGDINHNSSNNIAGPVQANVFSQNIEDGADHVVRITWNPVTKIVSVYFDCVFRLSGQQDLINQIFGGQNLVYWGFTAATGGSYNNQTVCLQENIISVGNSVSICAGMETQLSAGSSLDGVFSWSPTDFLDDPDSATPIATPTEDITYTVTFTDLCNNPVQATIAVDVVELQITHMGDPIINCINATSSNSASINFDADVEYNWSLGEQVLLSGLNQNQFEITQPGEYLIEANVDDVCFAEQSFSVTSDFSVYSADAGVDQVISCNQSQVTLSGSTNGQDAQIQWLPDGSIISISNSENATVSTPGNYTFRVTHPVSGCVTSDVVIVTENFTTPQISAGLQDTLTCVRGVVEMQNISISQSVEYDIEWMVPEGVFIQGATTISPQVNSPGIYRIVVTDGDSGCSDFADVEVVESELAGLDLSGLVFPNILSPNGDGKNEFWTPYLTAYPELSMREIMEVFELKIYNRWGNVVFESSSPSDLWNEADAGPAVYFYHIDYKSNCGSGNLESKEGYIHLVD